MHAGNVSGQGSFLPWATEKTSWRPPTVLYTAQPAVPCAAVRHSLPSAPPHRHKACLWGKRGCHGKCAPYTPIYAPTSAPLLSLRHPPEVRACAAASPGCKQLPAAAKWRQTRSSPFLSRWMRCGRTAAASTSLSRCGVLAWHVAPRLFFSTALASADTRPNLPAAAVPRAQVIEAAVVVSRPRGPKGALKVSECLVGDHTGCVLFTAKNEQGEQGGLDPRSRGRRAQRCSADACAV